MYARIFFSIMCRLLDYPRKTCVFSCWLSRDTIYYAFLLPLGLVMFTNFVLFVLIVKGLTCDRGVGLQSNQPKSKLVKLQVLALICCSVLMGNVSHVLLLLRGRTGTCQSLWLTCRVLLCDCSMKLNIRYSTVSLLLVPYNFDFISCHQFC
jgi:hypothetical protein